MRFLSRLVPALLFLGLLYLVLANRDAFASDAIFSDSFGDDACDGCTGGEEPPPGCVHDASGLNPPPPDWVGIDSTFTALWAPHPVGSAAVQIRMKAGQFWSYAFNKAMIDPNPERNVFSMNGDTSNIGPAARGAQFRYVAVSTCPTDFRPGNAASPDPTMQPACRGYAGEGDFMALNFGPPIEGVCNLDPTRTYYLNVIFDDPADGFNALEPCNPIYPGSACAFRVQIL